MNEDDFKLVENELKPYREKERIENEKKQAEMREKVEREKLLREKEEQVFYYSSYNYEGTLEDFRRAEEAERIYGAT